MYLHLGENTVVRTDSIIGIFDMDTSTISKWTKDYLSNATKNKRVINVSMELPKSFVVCPFRRHGTTGNKAPLSRFCLF